MSRALLDVNVLLASLDSDHTDHIRAIGWINDWAEHGWASCAITQNGFVRIISQHRYPNSVAPGQAIDRLAHATCTKYHEYWPCSVSMVDDRVIDRSQVYGSRQITDAYLLALAVANNGRLVTFGRTIPLSAVRDATPQHLVVLNGSVPEPRR